MRVLVTADTLVPPRPRKRKTVSERLAKHCRFDPLTGCIEWTGFVSRNGYGQLGFYDPVRKRTTSTMLAHRAAYEAAFGPIPDGLVVSHACDNRVCINPNHLTATTQAENMSDAVKRGRTGLKAAGATRLHRPCHELEAEIARLQARIAELEGR